MRLSFDYDRTYFPAFPVLDFTISATRDGRQQTIQGLIDSGSDITQIPLPVLRAIGARDVDDPGCGMRPVCACRSRFTWFGYKLARLFCLV